MSLVKLIKQVLLAAAIVSLVGCASNGKNKLAKGKSSGIGDAATFYGEDLTPEQERELLARNTFYFGFDRYDVKSEDQLAIYAHAKKLLENSNLRLRVGGHTDNRGSRAYNLGLGDRRANSVVNILALKGVPSNQIVTMSYGKEKPVALGEYEDAWKLNRRAELDYEEISG